MGSDTMLPLARRWAEAFMGTNPGVTVLVEGGGTAAGVAALIDGRIDLATGSRPLFYDEVRLMHDRHASLGVSYRCARDALCVYVHPGNPVRDIGMLQLKGVFTGRVGSWHKVGGDEAAVHVLIRPPTSGSHRLFRELVLDEELYSDRATIVPTTSAIVEAVRNDPYAVGYGGLAWSDGLALLAIDGHAPLPRTVRDGSYPLGRYLYLHSVHPPGGWARRFVDFAFTSEGQEMVEEVGFVALWEGSSRTEP
jgi:phosphate transport system substrate-binding protein